MEKTENYIFDTCFVQQHPSTVLSVYQCGWQRSGSGHSFGPAVWEHFVIHYIIKGKGYFVFQGKTYPISAGQGFLITPQISARYYADEEDPWEYYWVGFNGTEARNMLEQADLSEKNPVFTYTKDDQARKYLESLYHAFQWTSYKEYAMIGFLYLFFSCIAVERKAGIYAGEKYLKNAVEYIENSCFYKITVEDVARHVGVERSYMYRIFKAKMGNTVSGYIQSRKIEKAKTMLRETNVPVTEIACSLNFDSGSHFSKTFKHFAEITPMAYRKLFRK